MLKIKIKTKTGLFSKKVNNIYVDLNFERVLKG